MFRPCISRGFALVELMVVLGIVLIVIGLMLPSLQRVREQSYRTACANNMRQLGIAFGLYANANNDWVPRDATAPDRPPWALLLTPYLDARHRTRAEDLLDMPVFRCRAWNLEGVPTTYVINAFDFSSKPNWAPAGPVKLHTLNHSSTLPWLLEASNPMGAVPEMIFDLQYHDCWMPNQLPPSPGTRVSDELHFGTANVLYADGHVTAINRGEFGLRAFDGGR